MFENNPKRLEEFRKIASKKKAAHVRKELLGLPKELQKKIRAKEVEKMALDMFADKVFYEACQQFIEHLLTPLLAGGWWVGGVVHLVFLFCSYNLYDLELLALKVKTSFKGKIF